MVDDQELKARVARGAARLDQVYGPPWREIFSSGRLPNFANFRACVLGKMHGTYHDGIMRLFPDPLGTEDGLRSEWQRRQAIDHGFVIDNEVPAAERHIFYERLLEAWKPELERRGIGSDSNQGTASTDEAPSLPVVDEDLFERLAKQAWQTIHAGEEVPYWSKIDGLERALYRRIVRAIVPEILALTEAEIEKRADQVRMLDRIIHDLRRAEREERTELLQNLRRLSDEKTDAELRAERAERALAKAIAKESRHQVEMDELRHAARAIEDTTKLLSRLAEGRAAMANDEAARICSVEHAHCRTLREDERLAQERSQT